MDGKGARTLYGSDIMNRDRHGTRIRGRAYADELKRAGGAVFGRQAGIVVIHSNELASRTSADVTSTCA